MIIKLLLLQVSAHLVADYILQPQKWSDRKERKIISHFHVYHALIVGILSYGLSLDLHFWKASIALMILHLLLDIMKSWLILRKYRPWFFFLDQFLHLISITAVVWIYSSSVGIDFWLDLELNRIAIFTGFIFCSKPSNVIIKHILSLYNIPAREAENDRIGDSSLPNAGKLIGITERFMALIFILVDQYAAVGLIIAAKSILRINSREKSEYVLIGTLMSFGLALITGVLIRLI